jgi:hypothetical protein
MKGYLRTIVFLAFVAMIALEAGAKDPSKSTTRSVGRPTTQSSGKPTTRTSGQHPATKSARTPSSKPSTAPSTAPSVPPQPVSLLGMDDSAASVAYVCDASGSMMNAVRDANAQIRKSVTDLRESQSFGVIYFSFNAEYVDRRGRPATANNKAAVFKFMDQISGAGGGDPIPALHIALSGGFDLIYLITDGDVANIDDLLKYVKDNNSPRHCRINVIAIERPGSKVDMKFQSLAEENGGAFAIVKADKLHESK